MTPPAHRATTAHMQALYPWMAEAGLGSRGVPIGDDCFGGTFCFDPFELYQRVLTGLNVVIAGMVGKRKSSVVKTFLYRWLIGRDRQAVVIDLKLEYLLLAQALGVRSVILGAGSDVVLNPLDPAVSGDRQVDLLEAIIGSRLRRDLTPAERTAVELGQLAASETAAALGRQATLSDVLVAMFAPHPKRAARVGFESVEEFHRESRDAALALRGLCQGRLGRTLDGQTSKDLNLSARLVHFDLSSERNTGDIGVLMCCVAAWLQGRMAVNDGVKRVLVLDEAWRALEDARIARWLRGSAKLSREGAGLSHWFVMHRFGDFSAAGNAGSEQVEHARGLLSESETRILFALNAQDAAVVQATLGLTNRQTQTLPTMPPGVALWMVGGRPFLVAHRTAGATELRIVQNGLQVAA